MTAATISESPTIAAREILAGLVLDSGDPWGATAVDFQREDANALLDDDGARLHFWTRPRGGSKTTDLGGIMVAALAAGLIGPGEQGYAAAVDTSQAALLLRAAEGFVTRTPGLAGLVDPQRGRLVNKRTGAAVNVMSADAASAYGLLSPFFVVDELAVWTPGQGRRLWDAIVSAVPKVSGARLVVLTSAGAPSHWSYNVIEGAKSSPAWRVHEVAGPLPWRDEPALAEQRRLLPTWQYARLHLNQWAAADDALVTPDDLERCVTLDGPLAPQANVSYVIACDLGIVRDRSVAVVCHREPVTRDGEVTGHRIILDRIERWEGSKAAPVELAQVEEWLGFAATAYPGGIVLDPWQAVGMAQRLRARGHRVDEFSFSATSVARLARTLFGLLRDGLLALPDDDVLLDELRAVRLIERAPGQVRLDHAADGRDDQAVALALAAHHLLNRPEPVPVVADIGAANAGFTRENPFHYNERNIA